MKAIGSPRKNGNTEILTSHTLKAIEGEELDTESTKLAGFSRVLRLCNTSASLLEPKPRSLHQLTVSKPGKRVTK